MKLLKFVTSFLLVTCLYTLQISSWKVNLLNSSHAASPRQQQNCAALAETDPEAAGRCYNEPYRIDRTLDFEGNGSSSTSGNSTSDNAAPAGSASLDYRPSEQSAGSLTNAQIMVIVTMLMGPTVATACWSKISSKIFALGGAAYLIQEIMNYMNYKDAATSTQEMYATLEPETAQSQIEAFTFAEQQELNAADALKAKSRAILTLSIATTAAAVASFVEAYLSTAAHAVCDTTLSACLSACAGTLMGYPACAMACVVPYPACKVKAEGIQNCFLVDSGTKREFDTRFYANDLPVKPFSNEGLGDYLARSEEYNEYWFGTNSYASKAKGEYSEIQNMLDGLISQEHQDFFIQQMYAGFDAISELLISSANAKDSEKVATAGGPFSGLGIASAVAGTILAFKATAETPLMGKIMANGVTRGIAFTALAGTSIMAKSEVDKAEEKLRENAKIYGRLRDALMNAMNSQARMAGGLNNPATAVRNRIAQYKDIRDGALNAPKGGICLVGSAGEKRIDEKCQCAKNNTCAKAEFSNVPFQGQNLPSVFGSTLGGLASGANSLFAGNTQAADAAFGSIANNASGLRKLNSDIKKKLEADLRKRGEKVNFDKAEESFNRAIAKSVPRILASLPPNAKEFATGKFGSSGTGGINQAAIDAAKKGDTKDLIASVKVPVAAPKPTNPMNDFKFDFEDSAPVENTEATMLNQGDALSDFESNESDISDRPNESIFKIITVRYFKSAYPRFFTEEAQGERQELD